MHELQKKIKALSHRLLMFEACYNQVSMPMEVVKEIVAIGQNAEELEKISDVLVEITGVINADGTEKTFSGLGCFLLEEPEKKEGQEGKGI